LAQSNREKKEKNLKKPLAQIEFYGLITFVLRATENESQPFRFPFF